jgi:hypothetical protein
VGFGSNLIISSGGKNNGGIRVYRLNFTDEAIVTAVKFFGAKLG